jgi:hypothetical protein
MSSILDMLAGQLSGGNLSQISKQLGADESTTQSAITAVLPTLLGALTKNAGSSSGAASLSAALDRDHDGSILDDLGGFLGGNPQAGPGDGILRHALGGQRSRVESSLGKTTGLDAGTIGKLLVTLAPMVMGALGRAKREQHLDTGSLSSMLGREADDFKQRNPQAGSAIGMLLDADGDGDVDLGDILSQGGGILGSLFGGKR